MTRYLAITLNAIAWLLWAPAAVFAATIAATGGNESPLNVPPVLLAASAFIATAAGLFTLCKRVLEEYRANAAAGTPDKPLVKPAIFSAMHMLGSWLGAAFFFFLCMAYGKGDVNVWVLLAAVLGGGLGGAVGVEKFCEGWLPKMFPGKPA